MEDADSRVVEWRTREGASSTRVEKLMAVQLKERRRVDAIDEQKNTPLRIHHRSVTTAAEGVSGSRMRRMRASPPRHLAAAAHSMVSYPSALLAVAISLLIALS
jgi:hypothetical protein